MEDRNGGRVDDNGGTEREGRYCQLVRTRCAVRERKTKWQKEGGSWKNGREIRWEGRGIRYRGSEGGVEIPAVVAVLHRLRC